MKIAQHGFKLHKTAEKMLRMRGKEASAPGMRVSDGQEEE